MHFSHYLKQKRELNGHSQQDVANHLFVTRQTISNWENGKSYPDLTQRMALQKLYSISDDEFAQIEDSDDIQKIAYRTLFIRLSLKFVTTIILCIVLFFIGKHLGLFPQAYNSPADRLTYKLNTGIITIISFIIVFFMPKWLRKYF